jgi:hypothetical protein
LKLNYPTNKKARVAGVDTTALEAQAAPPQE